MATDRITKLLEQNQVTGIDFIYVHPTQKDLDVYFLRDISGLTSDLIETLSPDNIRIYSPDADLPQIEVDSLSRAVIEDQNVLRITTRQAGDFSLYRLKIENDSIDPYYNDVSFSFKANCPSDLDCKAQAHECPPDEPVDFPIDYLARDFWSYRRALLDFASLRYPDWNDRLEADAGVMMAEAMSALGDEMAYYQDRISREAYLETATQRRSIRKHARLVDYHMHDGLGATAWLDFTVNEGNYEITAGTEVFALSDDNSRINFEVGNGIAEIGKNKIYSVAGDRNEYRPHLWDEDQTCLPVGTTELYLDGHYAEKEGQPAKLPYDDFYPTQGKWVLIKTNPTNPAQPERAQMVRLTDITNDVDPVLGTDITHIVWGQEHALAFEFDLTILTVRGNMVPAIAGITHTHYFIVDKDISSLSQDQLNSYAISPTVEREGHDGTLSHFFTLPGSQNESLVYIGKDPANGQPEITLQEIGFNSADELIEGSFWTAKRSLLGVSSSGPEDNHFTLEDGTWQKTVGFQRFGEEFEHRDYVANNGLTICFGDGEFGRIPDKHSLFRVDYRLGGGRRSNVAPGSLKNLEESHGLSFVQSVTNPLSAYGGLDPETATQLRQLAPEAFKAVAYRAVRPEDYAEAAERLPWVQKAGAVFRWTGSWLSAFVTPDPRRKSVLEKQERKDLMHQLNRFRQACREANILAPVYADMDLDIHICVGPEAYPGEVKKRVLEALLGKKGIRPKEGYFSPDRFTFGTLLDRSTLEAAVQTVPGVRAVEQIYFRRRGWFDWIKFWEFSYDPGLHTIIRIENNPLHPGRGTIKIHTHGGL